MLCCSYLWPNSFLDRKFFSMKSPLKQRGTFRPRRHVYIEFSKVSNFAFQGLKFHNFPRGACPDSWAFINHILYLLWLSCLLSRMPDCPSGTTQKLEVFEILQNSFQQLTVLFESPGVFNVLKMKYYCFDGRAVYKLLLFTHTLRYTGCIKKSRTFQIQISSKTAGLKII